MKRCVYVLQWFNALARKPIRSAKTWVQVLLMFKSYLLLLEYVCCIKRFPLFWNVVCVVHLLTSMYISLGEAHE